MNRTADSLGIKAICLWQVFWKPTFEHCWLQVWNRNVNASGKMYWCLLAKIANDLPQALQCPFALPQGVSQAAAAQEMLVAAEEEQAA